MQPLRRCSALGLLTFLGLDNEQIMQILFPSDPFNKLVADEPYVEEMQAAQAAGIACLLFSLEDFQQGEFKVRPALIEGEELLYRGWMLSPDEYAMLHKAIVTRGAVPISNPSQYRLCHHLPEWYSSCTEFTPSTVVVPKDADFEAAVAGLSWSRYFVKDYVKSLTTSRGSAADTAGEIASVVALIEKFRGSIEGGVCIREFEELVPDTERRYFVWNGKAYASEGDAPALVQAIAQRINSRFYSVDTVFSTQGRLRLIELGDGQVSDRKLWSASQFMSMLIGGR